MYEVCLKQGIDATPFKFIDNLILEYITWCRCNISSVEWGYDEHKPLSLFFKREEDAMAFKIKFGL